jgi:hypothetical protein
MEEIFGGTNSNLTDRGFQTASVCFPFEEATDLPIWRTIGEIDA